MIKMTPRGVGWVAAGVLAVCGGCSGPYLKEFREVAGADLQSGVLSVLTGVVDGVFAVYEPDNPDSTEETDETS